jgi:putative membrane-bound dehydrogenase-like protein
MLALLAASTAQAAPAPIKILFVGDKGHHRPAERFRQIQPVLAARGIDLTYTDKVEALNPGLLGRYDGLLIYANTTRITPQQEKALLDFVEGGKGFIPVHCASYCFLNSPKYIALVGAQFKRHGTGTFRTTIAAPDHPIMTGFKGFESWDETYVHTKHNDKGRTILEYREDKEGKEPWTWVRSQGKGRVFYTAWGHDARTWGNPGFQQLLERGIRWAVGKDPGAAQTSSGRPRMTPKRTDVKPFEYVPARVPFYPGGQAWGTTTEPLNKMQKPLPPEESVKHFVHPTDFELKLFVSEPQLGGKPICMNWDERGRLWVAVTVDYPNQLQPEGKGRDKLLICEDTDGDGKADKITVFADKLSIPTSLTFARGGVIVHQAPRTLFLKDTDGDDKADVRQVLFTGWSTRDTHAGPSNLRYGLDNWIYGIVGYSGYRGEIGGTRHRFAQGFYRFKPDASSLEFLRNTNNNSWGVGLSEEGVVFGSTANGNPSVYLPIPNRYYEAVRGWSSSVLRGIAGNPRFEPITDKVRQVDFHGRFTAAAGHALYTARTYPKEYWNRTAFVTEPTGHLAATFVIEKQGADYRSHIAWNLLASDDEWSAPIMAEVGPDGNVWVIDWYNYIVQHNPTPRGFRTGRGGAYETELRDKKHGRIYRLVAKKAKPHKPLSLHKATPQQLVAALKNDNMFWRLNAQRLLVERGKKDVLPALIELAGDAGVDEIGLNAGVVHALWTMHGLGALAGSDEKATGSAVAALKHKSAGVRRNAVQVLPRSSASVKALLDSGVLKDADGQVRLMALLALADMPASEEAAKAIVEVLASDPDSLDRWLRDAATSAAAAHDLAFLKAALARSASKGPEARSASKGLADVVRIVAEHFARGGKGDGIPALVAALDGAAAPLAEAVITGLERGWPDKTVKLDMATEKTLARLLAKAPVASRGRIVQLAERWGSGGLKKYGDEVAASLLAEARNAKLPDAARIAAATQAIEFRKGDAATARTILKLVTPTTVPELGKGLLEAVGVSEATEVGPAVVRLIPSLTPALRPGAVKLALSRTAWTRPLLDALDKGTVRLADLSLDQQRALAAHPDKDLAALARKVLERGGGLPNADRQKVIDQLLPLTKRSGDVAAGKLVFKNHCMKCHAYSGEGAQIGPDLTGVAVHSKAELLTEIMDPSRSVEGNFRVWTVVTKKGLILNGLLSSETKTTIEVVDVEGKKHTLLRQDIEELSASPKSLMPDGFENQLKPEEVVNLLEFLTQRGKYLPLSLAKAATAVSTRGMFYAADAPAERLVFDNWGPKTFQGVPFQLVDPRGDRVPNVVLLYGPQGYLPPKMPKSVKVVCNVPAKAIHLLSGVSGWGFPYDRRGGVSLIVRLHYDDGKTEDHELKNGEHFADYIRRVDVPGSKFAFDLNGRQIRYLAVQPKRDRVIKTIELVKGSDRTAPVVMAITVEGR